MSAPARLHGRRILLDATIHAWSAGWTFLQMLAVALAPENDTVYLDSPLSLARMRPRNLGLLRGAASVRLGGDGLRVLGSLTLPYQRVEAARLVAARLVARQASRWARRVGFAPDLVWANSPYSLPLLDRFPAARSLYWTGDEVVIPGEEELLARVDAILCVSEPVYERHRARFGARTHFVPVACDFERYHAALSRDEPDPLAGVQRPVLGYAGWINQRLHVGLLTALADSLPSGTVVVAGPVQRLGRDERAALESRPNVMLLGPQTPDALPLLIRSFDVALVPYRDLTFNRNSNPVKFYEYLALGKPVVTTDIPTLRRFGNVASVGAEETFAERAIALLESDGGETEARIAVARAHSFDALLERLAAIPQLG